jgi:hypothetical protein
LRYRKFAALAAYELATGQVTDPAAIPARPNCGGEVFLNVRKVGCIDLRDPSVNKPRRYNSPLPI